MAEKITVYQCPACTGPLSFDGKIGKLKCEYCGSTYTTQEIEALYADKNKSAAAADAEAHKKAEAAEAAASSAFGATGASGASGASGAFSASDASGWGSDAAHMRAYNCTTCGAELICDETTAATKCPYCGNPSVIPGKFAGVDRPDYVIPFKVDKKQAVSSFKEYYKGRLLLPKSFESDNHIEEIKGVYVPFWMFSGEVEGRAQYEAVKEDRRRAGNEEIVRQEHYDVYREGTMSFSKIPVDASTKMPDDLMDSIEPFNYKEMRPFGMEYMPGYLANKYDVSKEESRKRADDRAVGSFRTALKGSVKNYDSVNVRQQSEKIRPEPAEREDPARQDGIRNAPCMAPELQLARQNIPLRHERPERQDDRRSAGFQAQACCLGSRSICGSLCPHALFDTQAAGRQSPDQRCSCIHCGGHNRRSDERQHETGRQKPFCRCLRLRRRSPSPFAA